MQRNSDRDADRQRQIDWPRERQLAALRNAVLPAVAVDGRKVSAAAMKSVLMAVDSRCGKSGHCWASADTLASDCGLSRRTVQRALTGLRQLRLLVETPVRRGRSTVIYRRICFVNLFDYEATDGPTGAVAQSPRLTDGPIGATAQLPRANSETGADACSESAPREGADAHLAAVHSATCAHSQRNQDRSQRNQDTFTAQRLRPKRKEGQREESVKGKPGGFLNLFQGEALSAIDLKSPDFLQRAYRLVIEHRSWPDSEAVRLTIFGFGVRCWRKRHQLREPVGWFVVGLGNRSYDWLLSQVDDEHDRQQARKLLRQLDGRELPRCSNLSDPQASEVRDFEAERQRQLAALKEHFG